MEATTDTCEKANAPEEMSNGRLKDIRLDVNWIKPPLDRIQQLESLQSITYEEFVGKPCDHQDSKGGHCFVE
jgi:hypothetical protein